MSDLPVDGPYERNEIWVGEERVRSTEQLPEGITLVFHDRSRGNKVRFAAGNRWKGVTVDLNSAVECTIDIGKIRVHFGGVRVSFVANSGRVSTGVWDCPEFG
ncbi:hypothetical protein [Microbacterium jejuense]|uniref:hypothetical protein n=1 Tax=Microbacterium jejuense TaxID=1263637 RepID=UPI0031EACA26